MFSLTDNVSGLFKSFFKVILLSSAIFNIADSSPQELSLRNDLFEDYDTNVRPVVNTMDNVSLLWE